MNRLQRRAAAHPSKGALSQPRQARLAEAFAEGLRQHQAGRLQEAERLYQEVLAIDPRHADCLHLLGVIALQSGRAAPAIELISRAVVASPRVALYHCNLGAAFRQQGALAEAVACYRQALALQPDYADACNNLATALRDQGELDEAVAFYRKAVHLNPDFAQAHVGLGNALTEQGATDAAIACHRQAMALRPGDPLAMEGLGSALAAHGCLDEAVQCYLRSIGLQPHHAAAHANLGAALAQLGRTDEAIPCYRRAIALEPAAAEAHFHLAMLLLARGDMDEGWREYEWRWQTARMRKTHRAFHQPQWRGEPAVGRTLLVHAEQGFGDTLQFCRYVTLAAARGMRVILEVPPPLIGLMRSLPGAADVVARGGDLPAFDLHCPMLSLPLAFATTPGTIPCATPYLRADPARQAAWLQHLDATGRAGPRIGLVWAGSASTPTNARRSLDPVHLAVLSELRGVQFVSLQKGGPPAPSALRVIDLMDQATDFADTAALVATLDLVISVDTAVAHLAGALGQPVWLLDRFDPCWRWLQGRRDSPWYPTLRLYRQQRPGDWDGVLADIVHDLRARVEGP